MMRSRGKQEPLKDFVHKGDLFKSIIFGYYVHSTRL